MRVGPQNVIAIALVIAVVVYVVLPLIVKGYSPDPAFSGILTGIIGLTSLMFKDNDNGPDPPTP